MDEKVITVPTGMDAASLMAMNNNQMFNNPWAYLILLSIFQNGGFGNRFGNEGGVVATDIDAKLNALSNQISQNQSTDSILSALQGNSFAQSQLAQNLNVDYNAIVQAINSVNMAIAQTASQTGMSIVGVQNAISSGNLNIIQSMKDCCCGIKTEVIQQGFNSQLATERQTNLLNSNITNQGYENQIRTINQTQEILTGLRAENTLTRASIDAFRNAWEQGRYADLLEEKNNLQNRLNLLELQNNETAAINAAIAPLINKSNA